jgi:hypothetical protein
VSLVIRDARLVTGRAGEPVRDGADLRIEDGRVVAIGTELAPGDEEIDAAGRVVMPGFVDAHTHLCWAGDRLDEWDALRSGREVGIDDFVRLPDTRAEADAIVALVSPDSALKAVGFEASRETAMSPAMRDYRVIHFATHGLVNSQRPELSGVVLSLVSPTGESQDGFLRLPDIYNMDLRADLVVLSACRTALGREMRGEGLVGITRNQTWIALREARNQLRLGHGFSHRQWRRRWRAGNLFVV